MAVQIDTTVFSDECAYLNKTNIFQVLNASTKRDVDHECAGLVGVDDHYSRKSNSDRIRWYAVSQSEMQDIDNQK